MTRKNQNPRTQSYFSQIDALIRAEQEAERAAMESAMDAKATDFLDAENALDSALIELDRIFN